MPTPLLPAAMQTDSPTPFIDEEIGSAARQTVDAIPSGGEHDAALRDLVAALAQAGQWDAARQTVDAIPSGGEHAAALCALASALAQAGQTTEAEAFFSAARQIAYAIETISKWG
jgi:hypothetical protein